MNAHVKTREDHRLHYEHYRVKLGKLENSAASCTLPIPKTGSQAKLSRNQEKYLEARTNFEEVDKRCNEIITKIDEWADQLLVNLTIKFCKEIKMRWYDEMYAVFKNMENIETQLRELMAEEN